MYVPNDAGSKGFAIFSQLTNAKGGWTSGLDFIESAGLGLGRPSDRSTVLTVDDSGDSIVCSQQQFRQLVKAGGPLLFKVWTGDGDDMLCAFRRQGSIAIELYWFAQLEMLDELFVEMLLRRFSSARVSDRVALIVDWYATSETFDWLGFLRGRVGYSGSPPDVLGFPAELMKNTRLELEGFPTAEEDSHVLHVRTAARLTRHAPPIEFVPSSIDTTPSSE